MLSAGGVGSQRLLLSLQFYHPGLRWSCEPWQKAVAYVRMGEEKEGEERRGEKNCAKGMNQLLQGSLPELIVPVLLFPRRKSFGREKGEEGFPSTTSRNHPPLAPSSFNGSPITWEIRELQEQKTSGRKPQGRWAALAGSTG